MILRFERINLSPLMFTLCNSVTSQQTHICDTRTHKQYGANRLKRAEGRDRWADWERVQWQR